MKKPIKAALNDMHDDLQLSADELTSLRQLEEVAISAVRPKRSIWLGYLATAAGSAVLVALLWLVLLPSEDKTELILADVVDHHLSHKTLKYYTHSMAELSDKFSYLGFMLSNSQPMMGIQGALTGARPCLILNIPAAQLRYQTADKRWTSVYQTRYERRIHGSVPDIRYHEPIRVVKSGVRVSVWQENGLLFAIAQP